MYGTVSGAVDREVGDDEEARGLLGVGVEPDELDVGGRERVGREADGRVERAGPGARAGAGARLAVLVRAERVGRGGGAGGAFGQRGSGERALVGAAAPLVVLRVLTARRHGHYVRRRRLCTHTSTFR